jgi:hypothetical protein
VTRYRVVSPTAIEVRVSGVKQSVFYGEVVQIEDAYEAQRLVNAGAVVPAEEDGP